MFQVHAYSRATLRLMIALSVAMIVGRAGSDSAKTLYADEEVVVHARAAARFGENGFWEVNFDRADFTE